MAFLNFLPISREIDQAVEKGIQPVLVNRNPFGELFHELFRNNFFVLSNRC